MDFDTRLWGPENKIVCVELNRHGLLSNEQLRVDTVYYRHTLSTRDWHGYRVWGSWLVARMRRHPMLATCLCYPVRWLASDSAHQLGLTARPHLGGMLVRRFFFLPMCRVTGAISMLCGSAATARLRRPDRHLSDPSHTKFIMKTSPFRRAAGALLVSIAATSVYAADPATEGKVSFKGNIVDIPCTITGDGGEVSVDMGSVSTGAIVDASTPKTPFSIKLSDCSIAIKSRVQVKFSGNTVGAGLLALSDDGAATSVAIQLLQDGKPLAVGTESALVPLTKGDSEIPFAAQYVHYGTDLPNAGNGGATAQFTLTYQ